MLHQLLKVLIMVHINKKPTLKMGILFLCSFLFLVIWLFILEKIQYKCPFHKYLHIYCPGCGGTRMIRSILRFDFYQAFRYNPLLFILFIIAIIFIIIAIIIYKKKKILVLPSKYSLIVLLIVLVIYMIVRNISIFSYLIPTEV